MDAVAKGAVKGLVEAYNWDGPLELNHRHMPVTIKAPHATAMNEKVGGAMVKTESCCISFGC